MDRWLTLLALALQLTALLVFDKGGNYIPRVNTEQSLFQNYLRKLRFLHGLQVTWVKNGNKEASKALLENSACCLRRKEASSNIKKINEYQDKKRMKMIASLRVPAKSWVERTYDSDGLQKLLAILAQPHWQEPW